MTLTKTHHNVHLEMPPKLKKNHKQFENSQYNLQKHINTSKPDNNNKKPRHPKKLISLQ